MQKKLYNLNEVMEVLGCSRSMVYRLIQDGELKALRVRASLKILRSSVELYIDRQIAKYQQEEGV